MLHGAMPAHWLLGMESMKGSQLGYTLPGNVPGASIEWHPP